MGPGCEERRSEASGLLIIAYGNELMGDDGAGPALAYRLEGTLPPSVRVRVLHQLTPELSEELSDAAHVVFVDARTPDDSTEAVLQPVSGSAAPSSVGHVFAPETLIELTRTVFGRCPRTWTLSLPTRSMKLGEPLSDTALKGIAQGLRLLRAHMRMLGYLTVEGDEGA